MRSAQYGVSVIELIMFIVIVSVGIVGILAVFNVSVVNSADPLVRKQALSIAEGLMEEILAKDFQNDAADPNNTSAALGCTPTTTPSCRRDTAAHQVTDRRNYNDVDDFNGWNQATVYQIDGTAAPITGSYTVTVAVAGTALGPGGAQVGSANSKQITVTVISGGTTISLVGYRTYYE